ncbi:MAG TPA: hypothetical protein VHU88_10830 [Sporichthyaceae bacterium]|jgi:hypothetical protein|nr:hypothetical protein [Sporichthyaceae bacterium]
MDKRRRRWFTGIAIGSAVLLVTGVLQPLPLSFGAAHADDEITVPLQNVIDNVDGDLGDLQDALDAAASASTALQTNATSFLSQLKSIVATAPSDPAAALTALDSAAAAEAPALAETGLTQALELASKVVAPSCTTLGALTGLLSGLGLGGLGLSGGLLGLLDSLLGPLAGPVNQLDSALSNAVQNYYTLAFTTLLTPVTLPAGVSSAQQYVTLAQELLSLLKMNWHTTYYPPGGGTPVVRDTPGFLGLPTVIDVDGKLGPDVCGLMNYSTSTGTVTQSISRLPLTAAFPMDIAGQFLDNTVSAGYLTQGSAAPSSFQTTITVAALAGGSGSGSTTDTKLSGAGPTFTQTAGLSSAVQLSLASTKPPATYHFASSTPGGSGGSGTQLNYTGSAPSTRFAYSSALGSLHLGVAQTPGATSFEYCTSGKGFCSNEPAASTTTETGSMHFLANQQVLVDQTSSAGATTCPATALLGDAHLTGTALYLAQDPTVAAGHVWVDTANHPVSGCLATASTTGTLPAGFQASQRLASWTGGTILKPGAAVKSGTVNCPTGTTVTGGAAGILFGLSRYFCAFPPVNTTAPSITGTPLRNQPTAGNLGVWTPGAPNTPTLTEQWQLCDSAGDAGSCQDIAGAGGTSYTPSVGDYNAKSTLRLKVTGTNADGSVVAYSAVSPQVALPPAPTNTAAPAISGTLGFGQKLTASSGTWTPPNGLGFTYQWYTCPGQSTANCTAVATGPTYTTAGGNTNYYVMVAVTATDASAQTGTANSTFAYIPPTPTSVTAPAILDGATVATGGQVFVGDTLSIQNPSSDWTNAAGFTYQWQHCDSGNHCATVATTPTYKVAAGDKGDTLLVAVTATNPDGTLTVPTAATGTVIVNALAAIAPAQVPDGTVNASAPSSTGTTYLGGSFDTVGPQVGNAGQVPGSSATEPTNYAPSLAAMVSGGTVNAVASDTTGGYFLGGSFTSVLGTPCPVVAHITSAGALDPTYCEPSLGGTADALDYVVNGKINSAGSAVPINLLAVGGNFGAGHSLALLDSTGLATFPAQPNGTVNTITDDGSSADFFYGGAFTQIGSAPAGNLGAVMLTAAPSAGSAPPLVTGAYPGFATCATCTGAVVNTMTATLAGLTPEILFGGTFDTVRTTDANYAATGTAVGRNNVAAISEANPGAQVLSGWAPNPNGAITAISTVSISGIVYLAGSFNTLVNGTSTFPGYQGLAEYGIKSGGTAANTSGTASTSSPNTMWKPMVDNGQVLSMVTESSLAKDAGVYLAGSFTSISGVSRHRLAHLAIPATTNPGPDGWNPNAGRTVRAIARPASGPVILAGGDFQVLGGTTQLNAAELNTNGTFTGWAPNPDGPVNAIAVNGTTVYLGGSFAHIGAGAATDLAAVTAAGALAAVSPNADGPVSALTVANGIVYVGGSFGHVGGAAHSDLAALSSSGTVTGWNPSVGGTNPTVSAIAVNGSTAYVGGSFTSAGGQARSNVAAIDTGSGLATNWNPGASGPVDALAVSSSTLYAGGSFNTAAGAVVSNAAGIDLGSGVVTWNPNANGIVRTLALLGPTVLAGGDFTTIGGANRSFVAQLDGSGNAIGFNPAPNAPVYSVLSTTASDGNPLVGIFGAFTAIAGSLTDGYGFFGG